MKPVMQWAVQPGDGDTVGEVVAKMVTEGAPGDGRVFLNGRSASPDEPVDVGDRLTLYPRREVSLAGVDVLAQRDGVLLVYKPAGLPAETTKLGEDSLVSALLSRFKGGKIHVATRLDTMVSGVAVCTLGRDASRRVAGWQSTHHVRRTYLALARGSSSDDEGTWTWPLGRRRDAAGRHVASAKAQDARPAETAFRVVARSADALLLELRPVTGRMHQIRAHASLAGLPLYGDGRYGGPTSLIDERGAVVALPRPALHAFRVDLPHIAAEAPVPADFQRWWAALGGDPAAWPTGSR